MNIGDFIFWYTGAAAWGVVALCFAFAIIAGITRSYFTARNRAHEYFLGKRLSAEQIDELFTHRTAMHRIWENMREDSGAPTEKWLSKYLLETGKTIRELESHNPPKWEEPSEP